MARGTQGPFAKLGRFTRQWTGCGQRAGWIWRWMGNGSRASWTRSPALSPPCPVREDRAVTAGGAAQAGGRWEGGLWSPEEAVRRHQTSPRAPMRRKGGGGGEAGRTAWPWLGSGLALRHRLAVRRTAQPAASLNPEESSHTETSLSPADAKPLPPGSSWARAVEGLGFETRSQCP